MIYDNNIRNISDNIYNSFNIDNSTSSVKVRYRFNEKYEPVTFGQILNDLLRICKIDNNVLSYIMIINYKNIIDMAIKITDVNYLPLKRVLNLELINMSYINDAIMFPYYILLKDLLEFINAIPYRNQRDILNNTLLKGEGGVIYSYHIENNTIIFK